ncbi:MAG: cobyrinic acid a,c-diamide synthase [Frankiales bacterium]|nr:cobyrinic acid a,c-diamide synthase [Frankiales bacterium]
MSLPPRLVIAAPSSGSGKTTVAIGVMAALRARGSRVAPFKVGPDYIDPSYHGLAAGRVGRNLDPYLSGADRIAPLLAHGSTGADIAVVEGVMGLFDGRRGTDEASTAHVAVLLGAPVILVVDARSMSRSVAALVHGFTTYDPRVRVAGVILNMVGSDAHEEMLRTSLAPQAIPVLGVIRRHGDLVTPSRHLGLVPVAERAEAALAMVAAAQHIVARSVDLDAVAALARTAEAVDAEAWQPEVAGDGGRGLTVAVARGEAFSFEYAEHAEILEAAGARVVGFDPLTDTELPTGTDILVIGGGFPEEHVPALADQRPLLHAVRDFAGVVYAECAGLLYLARTLDGVPMTGRLATDAAMTTRLTLGYREAVGATGLLAGVAVRGHEFHRTQCLPGAGEEPAFLVDGRPAGFAEERLVASYLHLHWTGLPGVPAALLQAARTVAA